MSAFPSQGMETRPSSTRKPEGRFVYSSSYLIGFVIAIVIIVLAIIIILWLIRLGLTIANEVLADGSRRGFPLNYVVGLILAIIVLIVMVMIAIWIARVAGRAVSGAR